VTDPYAGRLGELRMGGNNFSFKRFEDLDLSTATSLFKEAADVFEANPRNVSETMASPERRFSTNQSARWTGPYDRSFGIRAYYSRE
jgi:hypothetical protein